MALVALVCAISLAVPAGIDATLNSLAALLAVVALGMTIRFLKFYSAFAADVLRALLR